MPALGSNINAALGRIDYSPIARGGESMARGIAQAGQVKGQTYASIGQNISQGIQKYQKNQLEKKEQEGARNMLEKALEDPRLANALNLSPGDDNAYDKGELNAIITSAGGREKLSAFLNQGQQMAAQQDQLRSQNDLRAAQIKEIGMKETERQRLVAQQALTGRALQQAISLNRDTSGNVDYASIAPDMVQLGVPPEVANELVKGLERPAGGAIVSAKEYGKMLESGSDIDGVLQPDGTYRVKSVGTYGPGQKTIVNTGPSDWAQKAAFEEGIKNRTELEQLINIRPNIEAMEGLLDIVGNDGVITGGLANIELGTKSLLNAAGISNFEDVAATQEYFANSVSLVGQIIKQFGSGTGLSDADREFAQQGSAGLIKMDKPALKRMISIAKKIQANQIKAHNDRVNRMWKESNREDKDSQFIRDSLLFSDDVLNWGSEAKVMNEETGLSEAARKYLTPSQ
jgi:hypothetical protein